MSPLISLKICAIFHLGLAALIIGPRRRACRCVPVYLLNRIHKNITRVLCSPSHTSMQTFTLALFPFQYIAVAETAGRRRPQVWQKQDLARSQ